MGAALRVLEANGWTAKVLQVLWSRLEGYSGEEEPDGSERRRTILVGLAQLLLLGQELVPSVQAEVPKIIEAIRWLKGTIKSAEQLKELAGGDEEDDDEANDEDFGDEDDDEADD